MNPRKYPRAALPALALCLFAAAAMLVAPASSGQKGDRVAQEISQSLTSYESMTLDPAEVLRGAREEGTLTLQTARGTFDLVVEPYDVRSDDYRAVAASGDGVMTELPRTPSNSWRGHLRGREADTVVRLYLDGQKVQGLIVTPSETFFVEPARDLSAAASGKDFVFYAASDVRPVDATCEEATLGGKVTAEAVRSGLTSNAAATKPGSDESFAPKPNARIATEADFEFYQLNGNSESATNNDILNIMTQVDGLYDSQLGVKLQVVFQRVWTTNTDPYTLTNASNALEEFADNYDATFGTSTPPSRDLTHMFTGKDFDGSTIGIAFRGVVCDIPDASYGISQSRFSTVNGLRVTVTTHEIGHNFGATHPDQESPVPSGCDPSIMNSFVQNQATPTFCQFSRNQILTHLTGSGGACLSRVTQTGCPANSYSITPTSKFFTASGGTGTVDVTANAGCGWGVAEGSTWVTFNSEAGTGSGSTGYTVAANSGSDGPRRAFVDIGGKQFSIVQQASTTCAAGATQINIGQTVNGTLANTDCTAAQPNRLTAFEDLYTFIGRAGQQVRISMSTTGTPGIDTYLYLFAPNGELVAENDDIVLGSNTNSRIPAAAGQFFDLPQTGIYTIAATTFDNATTGSYTLSLVDNSSANSVSFSASSYTVDEGTVSNGLGEDGIGLRVITVNRTGDTTGTATVDFATTDGTANKKDYQQTLGTLFFLRGETSKTFTVFVPDDAFSEGPETINITLSNPVGTSLGATSTATLTINSNDATSGPSPVRAANFNTGFFVRQQYLDFLSREPDVSGFTFWKSEIDNCTNEQCREVKRINVSAAFFLSIEFQNTGYLVERIYKTAYGDTTSPGVPGTVPIVRLQEFLAGTAFLGQNVVVGQGPWQAQLDSNKNLFSKDFVLRQRFLNAFPLSMTSAQYVDKLLQNAGITLTTGERDALIAQVNSTADVAAGRAIVLRAVAENTQLQQNELRRAFVLMQYFGYLRRNPDDAPERDLNYAGWNFWLGKLNEFNGDFVRAEMVKAFITSDEYIARFGN